MTLPPIIGLTGRAGAGKDTVADCLVQHHGYAKHAFADPFKRFCQEVFGFTREQLWGPSELRNAPDPRWDGLTPRRALQQLGTEWGRAMHPDLWVRSLLFAWMRNRVERRESEFWVVPDVRFKNELQLIRDSGGVVWKIIRPDGAEIVGEAGTHESEAGVTGEHLQLFNDGPLNKIPALVAAALSFPEIKL